MILRGNGIKDQINKQYLENVLTNLFISNNPKFITFITIQRKLDSACVHIYIILSIEVLDLFGARMCL